MQEKHHFTLIDYALFVVFLVASCAIGLFFSLRKRNQKSVDDLLMGGRKMPIVPVALSLLTSFISGISLLAIPAEIYTFSAAMAWYGPGAATSLIAACIFTLPVLYRQKYVSVYRYLYDRFDSKILHYYAAILFAINFIFYMSIALYSPAVALSGVTELPTWVLILAIGILCTLYTAFGGLKAVVWTDTFQALVLYAGLITLIIKGTMDSGGISETWQVAKTAGRLQGAVNLDPNPFQYMTVWTVYFGAMFSWFAWFGVNQCAMQRYCSIPSIRKARIVMLLNIPGVLSVLGLVSLMGVIMFAYFSRCDPLKNDEIKTKDQLVIYFMLHIFKSVPGFSGLFLSCIFSGTLSTVSSGINSVASVIWEDFCRPRIAHMKSAHLKATTITKLIAIVLGAFTIALAFLAEPMGGVLQASLTFIGAIDGPLGAVFLFGILFPWANWIGCFAGVVVSTAINLWLCIGNQMLDSNKHYVLPTNTDCCAEKQNFSSFSCPNSTLNGDFYVDFYSIHNSTQPYFGVKKLYSLSYFLYSVVGFCMLFIVGTIVSLACRPFLDAKHTSVENKKHLLWWHVCVRGDYKLPVTSTTTTSVVDDSANHNDAHTKLLPNEPANHDQNHKASSLSNRIRACDRPTRATNRKIVAAKQQDLNHTEETKDLVSSNNKKRIM